MKYLSLLLWLGLPLMASTQNPCPSSFSFASLRGAIEENPKELGNIESVLACLPEDYRKNWTLMFDSKSSQQASFSNPRAILFGKDAKFIIAFNGHPDQIGYQRLETMEYSETDKKIVLREIIFSSRGRAPKFSQDNPSRCTGCHGNPSKPIFEEYNQWPGAYGENNDKLNDEILKGREKSELSHYKDFLANRHSHPRYQFLEQVEDLPVSPYGIDGRDYYYQSRTNLRFMDYLLRYQALRLTGMLTEERTLFEKYKHYLTFRIDACAYKHLGENAYNSIEESLQKDLNNRGIKHSIEPYGSYPYDLPAHLLALFDISMEDWSLSFSPKVFAYETGQGDFRKLVAAQLYKVLSEEDPDFRSAAQWEKQAESYLYQETGDNPRYLLHKSILESLDRIGGFPPKNLYQDSCRALGEKLQAQ